jgi:hypothetical protein
MKLLSNCATKTTGLLSLLIWSNILNCLILLPSCLQNKDKKNVKLILSNEFLPFIQKRSQKSTYSMKNQNSIDISDNKSIEISNYIWNQL